MFPFMMITAILFFLVLTGSGLSQSGNTWEQRSGLSAEELSALVFDVENGPNAAEGQNINRVCETDNCKEAAREILSGMNKSVNPCDNFYDFVCGSYNSKDRIPPYEASWDRFKMFQETVSRRIKGILEEEPTPEDILPVRHAKKWYRACMDKEGLESRGLKPLETILMRTGGWPMTIDQEEWDEEEHSWQSVEHDYFHITGSYVFYEFTPTLSQISHKLNYIYIKEGKVPLEDDMPYHFRNYDSDNYQAYVILIETIGQMFVDYNKADVPESRIRKDAEELVEFEKKLYMASQLPIDEKNLTISDFIDWYERNAAEIESEHELQIINFRSLLRKIFDTVNTGLDESTLTITRTLNSLMQVTKLLSETPRRTIVNYIHWHFVSSMLTYTVEEIRDAFFLLLQTDFDIKERSPRWLECTNEMKMDRAAAYAFVQKYFTSDTQERVRNMIENIREEMGAEILRSAWMDEEAKQLTKDKLDSMTVFIGFPPWYKNRTEVINTYKGLTIGYDHFENTLSFRKYQARTNWREFVDTSERPPTSPDLIGQIIDPKMFNAAYISSVNTVELPAALFQSPLFTPHLPSNVNYGISGVAIGHEIGHAFDDSGIKVGKDGKETELSKQMLELYSKRAECFRDQFNRYYGVTEPTVPGQQSIGMKTRGENIADAMGLHSVFEAYRKIIATKSSGNDGKLPGFEQYTDNQMFFISFAALWCEASTPKMLQRLMAKDVHSPGNLRVIGGVSNSKDFADAFSCPLGSAMNPENKCNIWKAPEPKVAEKKT